MALQSKSIFANVSTSSQPSPQGDGKAVGSASVTRRGRKTSRIRHTEQSEVSLAVLVWINPSPNLSLGEE